MKKMLLTLVLEGDADVLDDCKVQVLSCASGSLVSCSINTFDEKELKLIDISNKKEVLDEVTKRVSV